MQKRVLKNCHIYQMLRQNAKKRHLSFHTPGHKIGRWDITELSFSDNLSSPTGCILEAERDIAELLGGARSFILTDGSTCGVLSMLHAASSLGVQKIAVAQGAHKSVWQGCALLGLTPLVFDAPKEEGVPTPPTVELLSSLGEQADALLLTSPDYYGNIPDLQAFRAYCDERNILLLIDGAHGGHLHFDECHAGKYADLWVDGVHKSLPALTQGSVVSANEGAAEALRRSVDLFRTTSPSYPIMASVEYAVKYPKNPNLEQAVRAYANSQPRARVKEDYTKLLLRFGENAFAAQAELEKRGVFAEFCDGDWIEFYLSPATKRKEFSRLTRALKKLLHAYPYLPKKEVERNHTPLVCIANMPTERVSLDRAEGKICAAACGLFPPCTPLLNAGERITKEKLDILRAAKNTYGLVDKKILAVKENER